MGINNLILIFAFALLLPSPAQANAGGFNSTGNAPLPIGAGENKIMVLTPDGLVGINTGTTGPVAALDINGGLRIGTDPAPALCNAQRGGTLSYAPSAGGVLSLCDGTGWVPILPPQQH